MNTDVFSVKSKMADGNLMNINELKTAEKILTDS